MSTSFGRTAARVGIAGAVVLGMSVVATAPAQAAPSGRWDRLAQCESSGDWGIDTGNGYFGGLQFSRSTWQSHGGRGMPHRASRGQQIKVAEKVLQSQGWKAWPVCSRKLGYR